MRAADGGRVAADHGRVAHGGVVVDVALQRALRGLRVAVERELSEHGCGDDRRGAGKQPSASKFSHA